MSLETAFLIGSLFLLASIFLSKIAVRFGVPVLLLFLILGMLTGSEGIGQVQFDAPELVETIGIAALIFILYSGGLGTDWNSIRPVMGLGIGLSTLGVLFTALLVGWFAQAFLGFGWTEGVLLGAIIASTDAAAVFSVLRGKNLRLKGRLKPLLELESGSNDPMSVFLTLAMLSLLTNPSLTPLDLVPQFILQIGLGGLIGIAIGMSSARIINRLRLEYDGLYPVVTIALVLLTYGLTDFLGGSGFLAVYLVGLLMGREDFIHKRSLSQFHDGIAWLMQIAMFLTLGLQVFPSRLVAVAPEGLAVAAFLILFARPVSVFAVLAFARFRLRELIYISWVGLRGASPIVLAVFPVLAGITTADTIFHLVFFIVLTSVLLQGTLTAPMARWLNVYDDSPLPKSPLSFVMNDGIIRNDLMEITVKPDAAAVGVQIVDLCLAKDNLIVLIGRGDSLVVPRGDTVIQANDTVLMLAPGRSRADLFMLMELACAPDERSRRAVIEEVRDRVQAREAAAAEA